MVEYVVDEVEVTVTEKVIFPAVIGRKKAMIKAYIVNIDIQILLSWVSMKKAKVVLNFTNDTVCFVWYNGFNLNFILLKIVAS